MFNHTHLVILTPASHTSFQPDRPFCQQLYVPFPYPCSVVTGASLIDISNCSFSSNSALNGEGGAVSLSAPSTALAVQVRCLRWQLVTIRLFDQQQESNMLASSWGGYGGRHV